MFCFNQRQFESFQIVPAINVLPHKNRGSLVLDCTCVHALAETQLNDSGVEAKSAAGVAEFWKHHKYSALGNDYILESISIETTGAYGSRETFLSIGFISDALLSLRAIQRVCLVPPKNGILSAAKKGY